MRFVSLPLISLPERVLPLSKTYTYAFISSVLPLDFETWICFCLTHSLILKLRLSAVQVRKR